MIKKISLLLTMMSILTINIYANELELDLEAENKLIEEEFNPQIIDDKIDEALIEKDKENMKYLNRNPFESLVSQRKNMQKNQEIMNAEEIEKTPLMQRYDLSKYQIRGYIFTNDKKIILVEEKYSGKKFYLKLFDFIGNQNEQIIELSKNSIILGKFDQEQRMFVKTNIINLNKKQ